MTGGFVISKGRSGSTLTAVTSVVVSVHMAARTDAAIERSKKGIVLASERR